MNPKIKILLALAFPLLGCLTVDACGTPPSETTALASPSSTKIESSLQTGSAPRVSESVDSRGNRFELSDTIEAPGQRIDFAEFQRQVAEQPIERNGFTFGLLAEGELSKEELLASSPDFIATFDSNGTMTVVGFLPKEIMFAFPASEDRRLYGSDGKTLVGEIKFEKETKTDGQGGTTSFAAEFIPAAS